MATCLMMTRVSLLASTVLLFMVAPRGVDTADKIKFEGYPKTFELQHRFGSKGEFSSRGKIVLNSPTEVSLEQSTTPDNADALHAVATNRGDYFIRVAAASTQDETSRYVQTFVSACSYYESAMSDNIGVFLDSRGNIQSLKITTPAPCKEGKQKKKKIKKVRTNISVKKSETGPSPFVETYVEELKKKKETGEEADPGFLRKYWMYLVPIYLMIVLNSVGGGGGDAAPAEGGGGGGGGGN